MAESAVASRSLEERERELAATNVAPAITVASEYDRHTETLERGEAEAEDPWAFAGENESIDSFIAGAAPSCTAKAWIATQHDERKRLVEEYYEKLEGVEGAAGRESMGEIAAAWEAAETKTLDTLTGVLKDHKYGCGKWMVRRHGQRALVVPQLSIQAAWDVGFGSGLGCSTHCRGALLQLRSPPPVHLPCGHQRAPAPLTCPLGTHAQVFVPTSEVDLVWEEVVRALWEGKLGHTAKVSGAGPHSSGSHVICVYVDPFWDVGEVERVLAALRSECGIADSIKFKADGVTMLNLAKDNEFGIPPSFYAASRGSSTLQVQTPYNSKGPKKERGGEWGGGDGPRSYGGHDRDSGRSKKKEKQLDEDGFEISGPAKPSRKKSMVEREEPTAVEEEEKERRKKDKAKKKAEASGGFGALMGIDDGDADAILEKKRRKAEKKAAKKAAEEEQVAEESAASFAALKAKLASGGGGAWGDEDDEEEEAAASKARKSEAEAEEEDAEEEAEEEEEEEEEVVVVPAVAVAAAPAEPAKEKKKKALTDKELEVEAMMAALETNDKDEAKASGEVRPPPRRLGTRRSPCTLGNPSPPAPAPFQHPSRTLHLRSCRRRRPSVPRRRLPLRPSSPRRRRRRPRRRRRRTRRRTRRPSLPRRWPR